MRRTDDDTRPELAALLTRVDAIAGDTGPPRLGVLAGLHVDIRTLAGGRAPVPRVVVLRPVSRAPILLDALLGRTMLTARGTHGGGVHGGGAPAVTVTLTRSAAYPALVLTPGQRRALERLEGRGGRRGRSVPAVYAGVVEVGRAVGLARVAVDRSGGRWAHANAVLRDLPLQVSLPPPDGHAEIILTDLPVDRDRLPEATMDAAHLAVAVLDYRDLLVGPGTGPDALRAIVQHWVAATEPSRLLVAVDGLEQSRIANWENLHRTVRGRAEDALGNELRPDDVLPLASSTALAGGSGPDAHQVGALRDQLHERTSRLTARVRIIQRLRSELERLADTDSPDSSDDRGLWSELTTATHRPVARDLLAWLSVTPPIEEWR